MSAVGQLLHAIKAHHLFACHDHPEAVPESLADYVSHFVRFSAGGIRACAVAFRQVRVASKLVTHELVILDSCWWP